VPHWRPYPADPTRTTRVRAGSDPTSPRWRGPHGRYLYLARHAHADPDTGALTPQGREQAALLGERLRRVGPDSLRHGPLPRAERTARLAAERVPGLTARPAAEAGDYVPHVPAREELPPEHADAVTGFVHARPAAELDPGPALARRARSMLTGPVEGTRDRREAVVTHAFLVGHLVAEALGAPRWRWAGQAPANAALTVIRYPPDAPASVLVYNDMSHLPERLRWTGFPDRLRP
jgi:probable phosphoglycerate mutase